MMNNKFTIKALYIHIPFCKNICSYCDFFKIVASESFILEYCQHLIKEIEANNNKYSELETIYIGGGTPSSLPLNLLEDILKQLHKLIDFNNIKEFTIEVNPLDVTKDILDLFNKYKITRISVGVQSFDNTKLKILGRVHKQKDLMTMFKLLSKYKFNISCDLIYGIEKDSFKRFKKDLKLLLRFKITHISLYSLILEEKTILMYKYNKGEFNVLNEDDESSLYYNTCKFLKQKKFIHYEISNFAKKGYFSKHNLTYWNNEHYIGVGCNASSYIENVRYTNPNKFKTYYEGIKNNKMEFLEAEKLSNTEIMKEEVLLNLRKTSGIDTKRFFEKFNKEIYEVFPSIEELLASKLLIAHENNLFIPESKLYISNYIINKII